MNSFACGNVDISKFLHSEEPITERTKVKWKSSEVLLKMLEDGTFADVKYITGDGGSVSAHQCVLTHVCPILCAGYERRPYECNVEWCDEQNCDNEEHCKSIYLEMSIGALKLFLILLYTTNEEVDFGVPELSGAIDEHFEELYKAVRENDVEKRLGLVLLPALARHLTPENCWRFYQDSLRATPLYGIKMRASEPLYYKMRDSEICYNYILGNYAEAIKSKTVLHQMKWDFKLLQRIMVHAESQAARQQALRSFQTSLNFKGIGDIKEETL